MICSNTCLTSHKFLLSMGVYISLDIASCFSKQIHSILVNSTRTYVRFEAWKGNRRIASCCKRRFSNERSNKFLMTLLGYRCSPNRVQHIKYICVAVCVSISTSGNVKLSKGIKGWKVKEFKHLQFSSLSVTRYLSPIGASLHIEKSSTVKNKWK